MKRLILLLATVVFVFLTAVTAFAGEAATPELSLNDAVTRALTHSEAVRKAAKEVKLTESQRDEQEEDLGYIPTAATGEVEGERAFANLLSANLTWRMSERSLSAEEDAVVLDACNKYWGIQQAVGAVEVARYSLRQAELDLNKARISQKVGLIAQDALLSAESKQAGAKYDLAKAQNDLETDYTAFNQLVGLQPEDRPVLAEEPVFTLIEDNNLDYRVTKVLENSPSVWQAQEKVKLQKTMQDLMFYTGEYRPLEERKIEVDQAKLDAVSAKEAAEILTRNMFYSVRTLEENYPAAEQGVKLAEENLRVAQTKYEVGMAIKADVAALETSLAQVRLSLQELKKNHAYLSLALEKPWAY